MEAFSFPHLLSLQVHDAGHRGGSSRYLGFIISYRCLQFVTIFSQVNFYKTPHTGKSLPDQIVYYMHKIKSDSQICMDMPHYEMRQLTQQVASSVVELSIWLGITL